MAGRHVFFSFHYDLDVWRATIVRNTGIVDARSRAGWSDSSLWEEAEKKGKAEIQRLIDDGLKGTSVTAILIGAETASRPWVKYEIEQSIARGNGIFGVYIDKLKNQEGRRSRRGSIPKPLADGHYRTYSWNRDKFRMMVERAAIDAGKPCLAHQEVSCLQCRLHAWWVLP